MSSTFFYFILLFPINLYPFPAPSPFPSSESGSPYETLHSYVASAVAPLFKSFVRESGVANRDGDKMAASMEKKIAELEMGLLHLQQNIDIPEITLVVHPTVAAVIKQAEAQGTKPKVTDFGDKVEDSSFLNALQNMVSKWIREIQKVREDACFASCGGESSSSRKGKYRIGYWTCWFRDHCDIYPLEQRAIMNYLARKGSR